MPGQEWIFLLAYYSIHQLAFLLYFQFQPTVVLSGIMQSLLPAVSKCQ
jgi:hypothetical protein